MFRLLIPIILIGSAVAGFILVVNPMYKEVSSLLSVQTASYDKALDNSKDLEAERDKLTNKKNSFSEDDLEKLETLLPDNVDNIRLIIEIQTLAAPFGMVLKDVKYNPDTKDTATTKTISNTEEDVLTEAQGYGTWNLEFSVEGSYDNFLNFSRALENNLRIVDITSVQFSSDTSTNTKTPAVESYKYSFKIKTYWMKN